ncbi:MAG TPA: DUF2182 domain-containing protein, partial [Bryobacteraceae bacterium]|nr:DUF2182 domain-containing protein [Bryobacteraceae bacterium]
MAQEKDVASGILEAAARHDRLVIAGALGFVSLLAWAWLLTGGGMDMPSSMDMNMVMPKDWTPLYALVVLVMWWVMMIAMMLPSAAPMILLFSLVNRRSRVPGAPYVPTAVFATGYLVAWGAFSLAATLVQWCLEQAGWLTMGMT